MNPRRFILPLVWFNLRQFPAAVWFVFCILLSQACMFAALTVWLRYTAGVSSSISNSLNLMSILFCCIIGTQFMFGGGAVNGCALLLPAGEFLLARAVPRSTAYFTRIGIVFTAMLIFPLVNLCVAFSNPDLQLSLYHSKTQSTQASDSQARLQAEFPDSQIVPATKVSSPILVVPQGSVLIAAWEFWVVFMLALLIQSAVLIAFPFKQPLFVLMVVCLAPILLTVLLCSVGGNTGIMEIVFVFFIHHWIGFTVLAFSLFVFIQRLALKRIRDLEVI